MKKYLLICGLLCAQSSNCMSALLKKISSAAAIFQKQQIRSCGYYLRKFNLWSLEDKKEDKNLFLKQQIKKDDVHIESIFTECPRTGRSLLPEEGADRLIITYDNCLTEEDKESFLDKLRITAKQQEYFLQDKECIGCMEEFRVNYIKNLQQALRECEKRHSKSLKKETSPSY